MTTKAQKRFELIAEYAGLCYLDHGVSPEIDAARVAVRLADEVMKHYPEEDLQAENPGVYDLAFERGMRKGKEELVRRMEEYNEREDSLKCGALLRFARGELEK